MMRKSPALRLLFYRCENVPSSSTSIAASRKGVLLEGPEKLESLVANLDSARRRSKISIGSLRDSGWSLSGGVLSNARANFFEILTPPSADQRRELRIRQEDGAEVVLLTRINEYGVREFLLQERVEPGLIGTAIYTSTIQSTWQNLRAEHNGSLPPLAEIATSTSFRAKLLIDETHWDWKDLYLDKGKRYRVMQVADFELESPRHTWVSEELIRGLAMRPHSLSVDLMVAISLLLEKDDTAAYSGTNWTFRSHLKLAFTKAGMGVRRSFFPTVLKAKFARARMVKFSTSDREVSSWTQPLMDLVGYRSLNLEVFSHPSGSTVCRSLTPEIESPLKGRFTAGSKQRLNHASDCNGCKTIGFQTSAEGGRFLWNEIKFTVTVHNHAAESKCDQCLEVQNYISESHRPLYSSVSQRLGLFALWLAGKARLRQIADAC